MTTLTEINTTQVYQVFIKATPEQIWDAITKLEFTEKYFYGSRIELADDRYRSVDSDGNELVTGALIENDPPHRLVHGWRSLYDAETVAEAESRVTWEIESRDGGMSLLTVVHDRLEASPRTAEGVSGTGWMMVLSGLKTLLETGEPLAS
jgi:uncharacterized protein YndB with AHSA1/START domain